MRCSYEVVFPLYSLPFVYLLFLLFSVLCCRSILYIFVLKRNRDAKAFYYALLSIPKIAVIHALLAGVLYQSYPYIVMLWSLCANAVHLAAEGKISMKEITRAFRTTRDDMVDGYGSNIDSPGISLLAISAQMPPIFYMLTIGISHPSVFCRYDCMWNTVEVFMKHEGFVPQFHGKWPFIAVDINVPTVVDLIIQEPASFIFSLLNFYSSYLLYVRLKFMYKLDSSRVWIWYTITGMIA
ncbi:hypothetical protein OSTOST_02519, partial [Ostertagia ostertagi]